MASLLIMNNLLRYLLIIGKPVATLEIRSGSSAGLFHYWKCPMSRLDVNLYKIFLNRRQTSHNGRGWVGLRTGLILLAVTFNIEDLMMTLPPPSPSPVKGEGLVKKYSPVRGEGEVLRGYHTWFFM